MAMYQAFESSVVHQSPESNVLIIRQGRTIEQSYDLMLEESKGHEVTTCITYLVVAPTVQVALQAIEQHLPNVWRWAVEESASLDSDAIFQALTNSFGPLAINYIGHDGTSGQGAVAWSWAYPTLTPAHRELALQWLFENLEVLV